MTISTAAIAVVALAGPAAASPPAAASCVGIITSAEGSQLPAGSVGQEVSGLARSIPHLGEAAVSPLAREHGGNCA